ncbi:MAG: tRNA (cytidine(56)-2'-O)-methyltransferase, partial [Candidatus Methanoperedens sp.]
DLWGGSFYVKRITNWMKEIRKWKESSGKVLHLTMYGVNLPDVINDIVTDNLLVVVGAEKVPPELYALADWNVAVGNQPHSEVAALAIVLDRLAASSGIEPLKSQFSGGEVEIVPKTRGKEVREK